MLDDRVINPSLYKRAKKAGDPSGIKISMPQMKASYSKELEDGEVVGKIKRGQTGEKYIINCPFCSDTRHRLTISYLYCSTVTEDDGTTVHFGPIAHCFNENCLQDPDNARRLNKILTGTELDAAFHGFNLTEEDGRDAPDMIQLPDELIEFSDLGNDHPASEYLINRGLNLEEVDNRGARYCKSFPEWPIAEGRIFFPCHSMSTYDVIGGQARAHDYEEGDIAPKDLTLPGTTISQGAFGLTPECSKGDYVVITEAPIDAITTGPQAIASFGGTINNWQSTRLIENFKFIIFMPDGDVRLDSDDPGKADIARRVETQINHIKRVGRNHVVWVKLPENKDPTDLGRETVSGYIVDAIGREALLDEFSEIMKGT